MTVRYVSLFSGIEAASVAWAGLGWKPVAFAEVEPFPCRLLAARFPGVPNLGDVSKIDWSPYAGSVDLVVGGSPCQAFSVAGKRGGLMDERGRLMLEYVRAVGDLRPRWLLWENVPGVLSQDGGRAFGTLLGALDELGYSLAWRVLDAQFFGVAQRRRRVFVVGHLGAAVGPAAAVLFEPDCLRRDNPPSREKRKELAALPAGGAEVGFLNPWDNQSKRIHGAGGAYQTLYAAERGGVSSTESAMTPAGERPACYGFPHAASGKAAGIGAAEELSFTMRSSPGGGNAVCYDTTQVTSRDNRSNPQPGGPCHTLSRGDAPLLCAADDNANAAVDEDLCGTLKAGGGALNSNGTDLAGTLCARDWKGVGDQDVSEGKVIVQWDT